MQTTLDSTIIPVPAPSMSATMRWAGRVLSALPVLFLAFEVVIKMIPIQAVVEATEHLGIPLDTIRPTALVLAICVALYVIPRTAVVGAVLLTGYFGGAVFAHVRVGNPMFSHTLFPIYVAVFLWAGLYLRDARVRGLIAAR